MAKKRFIQIYATEKITHDVSLEIGKDITEEEAKKLLAMEGFDYSCETKEYAELNEIFILHDQPGSDSFEDVLISEHKK